MPQVLIVEDNISLNKVYSIVLQKEGYDVANAFDGRDGLDLLTNLKPDLILLDMLMPRMGGIEFLKHFSFKDHPQSHVIMLSNVDEEKTVKEAIHLGASSYIIKSDNSPKDLVARLREILG